MIKRIVLAVVVMLAAAGAAVADERMYIDGGYYDVAINQLPKNSGAKAYAQGIENARKDKWYVQENIKLTKGEWAAVNKLLDRYETERGDTFIIVIGNNRRGRGISVFCEFTSNTQYNTWTCSLTMH